MGALSENLRVGLEDLAKDVALARGQEQVGRLALLCCCEIRRWARLAGNERLAAQATAMIVQPVPVSRRSFLESVDALIEELEQACDCAGLEETATSLRCTRAGQ
jgi:hypothetical protein